MKAVKITWMGKPLREVYSHATKWQVAKYKIGRAVRWAVIRLSLGAVLGAVVFGAYAYGTVDARAVTVVNQIVPGGKESMSAVMARIADCESGDNGKKGTAKQFNADGSIVTHVNSDGTTDVGKYQINMQKAHIVAMAKLGFNPLTEEGNEAYAKWLYENKGTGDWQSSRSCWQ